ncbi:hypothetical protein NL676_000964 [Syzygium grande]|nr:hypothetical protein NL676_000964 [Syzygium grande]
MLIVVYTKTGDKAAACDLFDGLPVKDMAAWTAMFAGELKKNPGCSWFKTKKGEIHEFFAGDAKHPRSSEINGVLVDLLDRLKGHGYQQILSSVAYDVSEDEKKRILMAPSEKLALAFGLMDSSANCPVRIMKNLRICETCHSFMCGVSHIIGREIIVRDNVRFHHFNGGTCSCGNFC